MVGVVSISNLKYWYCKFPVHQKVLTDKYGKRVRCGTLNIVRVRIPSSPLKINNKAMSKYFVFCSFLLLTAGLWIITAYFVGSYPVASGWIGSVAAIVTFYTMYYGFSRTKDQQTYNIYDSDEYYKETENVE